MRKLLVLLALVALLAACAPAGASEQSTRGLSPVLQAVSTLGAQATPYPTACPRLVMQMTAKAQITPFLTSAPSAASPAAMTCSAAETSCIVAGHFVFQNPLPATVDQAVDQTYRYGTTEEGKREPHHGDDFLPSVEGTPVLAVGDGSVVVAGNDKLTLYGWVTNLYGNLVVLEHHLPGFEQPVYTLYGHLSQVNVKVGQNVKAGDEIGEVGSTGIAIGSHLYIEVRMGKNDYKSNRNPDLWLKPLPGEGVLAGQLADANGDLLRGRINIQRLENGQIMPDQIYPLETYTPENGQSVNGDDLWHENFATGGLAAGEYRLTFLYSGRLYEQHVEVQAGRLTLVKFVVQ